MHSTNASSLNTAAEPSENTDPSTRHESAIPPSPSRTTKHFAHFRLRRETSLSTHSERAERPQRRHTTLPKFPSKPQQGTRPAESAAVETDSKPHSKISLRYSSRKAPASPVDVYNHRPLSGDNKSSIASSSSTDSTPSDLQESPASKPESLGLFTPPQPRTKLSPTAYATPERPSRPVSEKRISRSPLPKFVLPPNDKVVSGDASPTRADNTNKENRVRKLSALFQRQDSSPTIPSTESDTASKSPVPKHDAGVLTESSGQASTRDRRTRFSEDDDSATRSPRIVDLVAKFENDAESLSPVSPKVQSPHLSLTPLNARTHSSRVTTPPAVARPSAAKLGSMHAVERGGAISTPSTNERAERVAIALEKIYERVEDYANDPESEGNSTREAIIPLMIESMQQHRDNRKVADRALNTLRKLTVSDECRAHIGECGGIEAVVGIMRCHSLLIRIQTQACLALANLTYQNDKNKDEIVKCGGFQVVIAALSKHWSDVHVQGWGCLALRNFTNYSSESKQDTSVVVEAVSVLLCALERYPNSVMVQQHSLTALVNIARASRHGLERILREGGVCTLVVCMRNNVRCAKLSEIALCLARLVVEDKKNQKLMGYSNGIEAMTAIMDKHRGELGIVVKGCAIFRILAFDRKNRDLLGKCGSIRTIITSMTDHTDVDAESVSCFLRALGNSTYDSIANKTLAGRLGGVVSSLKFLTNARFKDNEMIVEDACRALRNLVDGIAQNHRLMIKNKGIAIVLDAIRLHGMHSAGVAEHGIAIFVNMASNRSFASQLNEGSGDITQVARTMRSAHDRNVDVGQQTTNLLASIGLSHSGKLIRQGSGLRDLRSYASKDRLLRGSASHHRFSEGDEHDRRLQRLRSVPLPLSKFRQELTNAHSNVTGDSRK